MLIRIMVILFSLGFSMAHAQEPLTLKDCYALALKQSEKIAVKQGAIKEAEGRFLQSLSSALPQFDFNYTHTYEQGPLRSDDSRFTFSQPLFTGFKEFVAIAGSKAEKKARQEELLRAKQLLFVDVSDAFYYYRLYQDNLKSAEDVIRALASRVEELTKRVDLGRSRASELALAQARVSRQEADKEQVVADLQVARQLLEFLIGIAVDQVSDNEVLSLTVKTPEDLQNYALQRPDVKAAQSLLKVAQKTVSGARADFYPTVSLDGNYYTKKTSASSPDWDVALKVDVPIFHGGDNLGKLKEAKAKEEAARFTLQQAERQALLEIRQAYAKLEASFKRGEAYKKALEAADKNYQLQAADYRLSMVSNLDVLQAITDLEDVRGDYIAAANQAKRFYWQFKVATGDVNVLDR